MRLHGRIRCGVRCAILQQQVQSRGAEPGGSLRVALSPQHSKQLHVSRHASTAWHTRSLGVVGCSSCFWRSPAVRDQQLSYDPVVQLDCRVAHLSRQRLPHLGGVLDVCTSVPPVRQKGLIAELKSRDRSPWRRMEWRANCKSRSVCGMAPCTHLSRGASSAAPHPAPTVVCCCQAGHIGVPGYAAISSRTALLVCR